MARTTTTATCPVCGQTGARVWKTSDLVTSSSSSTNRGASTATGLVPDDLAITDRRYGTTLGLLECRCGFRFADPAELPDLVALYSALDDPAYEEGAAARSAQQRVLLAAIRRVVPGARTLLDVGAASGLLVGEALAAGLDAVGIEPSATLAGGARDRGLDVRTGVLPHPELSDRRFDIVALVDVVEHVVDPVGLLRAAREHLAEHGVVLVVTPDAASVAARVLGKRWWHLRLAHVGYFTQPTLSDALARAGLIPMKWWRPGWVFELGYLGERVGSYVPPVGRLVRRAGDSGLLRRTVPLNPRDSLAVIARAS